MAWLRTGDNASTYPIVLVARELLRTAKVMVLERESITNELFGFVMRCALQSAAHETDYVVSYGTAEMMGGTRTDRLLKLAERSGYFTREKVDGRQVWKIVEDAEFIHIRLKSEREWEQQQRRDSSNTRLTGPVRFRDGDACRYCGNIVYFNDRKSDRRGSYDHLYPGQEARTPDDLVVACGSCNSARRDFFDAHVRRPLLPVPVNPYYLDKTATWLNELKGFDYHVVPSRMRPDGQSDHAPSDLASSETPQPALVRKQTSAEDLQIEGATGHPVSAAPVDGLPAEAGSTGSGRDGTGRAGPATPGIQTPSKRKRSRRGRPR